MVVALPFSQAYSKRVLRLSGQGFTSISSGKKDCRAPGRENLQDVCHLPLSAMYPAQLLIHPSMSHSLLVDPVRLFPCHAFPARNLPGRTCLIH